MTGVQTCALPIWFPSHDRVEQMATKREYLKTQGITVGRRGRFSAAAKQALAEADKNGIKFTAETKTAKN